MHDYKVRDISVKKLNLISKGKEICCIGCGRRFYELIDLYADELFIRRLSYLADNDQKLWGRYINIGGKKHIIDSPKRLLGEIGNHYLILITADNWASIIESVKEYIPKGVTIYRYPKSYYGFTGLLFKIGSLFRDERRLLFRAGDQPHENADEITRYITENYHGRRFHLVYLTDGNDIDKKPYVRYIDRNTLRKRASFFRLLDYCFTYAGSKYLFYENEVIKKVDRDQMLIFLNHGTIPLKKVADVLTQPKEVDYAVCPGQGCAGIYTDQYGIPAEKQIYMLPARINRLYDLKKDGSNTTGIHKLVGTDNERIVLWLPTFRQLADSNRIDSGNINPLSVLFEDLYGTDEELSERNIVLVIKKHPREKIQIEVPESVKNIMVIKDEDLALKDMCLHDLLRDADALLTDYSGIAFEYMLLNRPIGYVIDDIEEYHRGFAVADFERFMPGTIIRNRDDLLSFFDVVVLGNDPYSDARNQLVDDLFGDYRNENGAEKLIEFLDGL